jgi:CRP/FNR family transcriptional regulator
MIPAADSKRISREREDALAYLPHKGTIEYRRYDVVYDEQKAPEGLYLIVNGRVKVATRTEDGSQAVTGLLGADVLFGEMALLHGQTPHREQATTMEKTTLMCWSAKEIESQIERQANLGLALVQLLAAQCMDLEERLESLACNKTSERVALALLRLTKSGIRGSDGTVRIPPLTHQVFAEYIGTSREIVTAQFNQLRRQGCLRYSRQAIELYPDAIARQLQQRQA